jgi:hypothetical protein
MWTRTRCIAGAGRSPRLPGTWDMTGRPSAPTWPAGGSSGNASPPAATRSSRTWTMSAHGSRRDPHLWVVTLFDGVVDLGRPTDHVDVMAALSASTQSRTMLDISRPSIRTSTSCGVCGLERRCCGSCGTTRTRRRVGSLVERFLRCAAASSRRPRRECWGLSCLGLRAWRERR